MASSILVDTNVLVYFYDLSSEQRCAEARRLLERLWRDRRVTLSTQNLAEFWVSSTRRITPPLSFEEAARRVRSFTRLSNVLPVTAEAVQEAIRGVRHYQLSYWDAQMWAVAQMNGIDTIVTEDLPSAPRIETVRFINPFTPGFDPGKL